jgi:putative OmpL-like beta-barrel porin-2
MKKTLLARVIFLCVVVLRISSLTGWADDANQQAAPESSPTPAPPTLLPGMAGPLAFSQKPLSYDVGVLGTWYLTGVGSGLLQWQTNRVSGFSGNDTWLGDVSNGQVMINKPDGLIQVFAQVGAYSLPDLGAAYIKASDAIGDFWGAFPQGFLKLQLTDAFSIQGGKLPTLIGAEYTFSFENMNVERGLLWNQENAVNRGVQANYAIGPVLLSFAWSDGFYSSRYSWATGAATWTIDSANTISFVGGGNTASTTKNTLATPLFQNNEQIYNLIYTHTEGPWTITPYVQITHVPANSSTGARESANTYGGALLGKYSFPDDASIGGLSLAGVSLPLRWEFIASDGSVGGGAPNLLYGPGSEAWSITFTPTYQYKIAFVRPEVSYVQALDRAPGLAFGLDGNSKTQTRLLVEGGVIF